jgi:hypothetical protein
MAIVLSSLRFSAFQAFFLLRLRNAGRARA